MHDYLVLDNVIKENTMFKISARVKLIKIARLHARKIILFCIFLKFIWFLENLHKTIFERILLFAQLKFLNYKRPKLAVMLQIGRKITN